MSVNSKTRQFSWLSYVLTFFFVLGGTVEALAQLEEVDPTLRWQMIETPHFRINYHEGLDGLAQEAAVEAEDAHKILSAEFDYAPPDKTEIVIADATDFANGFADPISNKIVLYVSSADIADWANPRLASWMQLVIFHEYTHIVDIDGVHGITATLRNIFGHMIMPNWKPQIFVEGIAAYEKYKHLGESRANNARDAMYLRTMVLEKKFPRLDQTTSPYSRREWMSPSMLWHDVGPWLVRYLEERFGNETIRKIDQQLGSDLFALIDIEKTLRQVTGFSAKELYQEFQKWAGEQFSEQIENIRTEGVTSSQPLTKLGYWSDQPRWSPDGKQILYAHRDAVRVGGLRIISSDGQKDHPLLARGSNASWSPDGTQILYIKTELEKYKPTDKTILMSDLYLYDFLKKREMRLTRGERVYKAEFFPDGQRILLAKYRWGDDGPMLAILDRRTNHIVPLKEFGLNDYFIHSFAISPDGQQIALSIWRRGGYQDIYLMNSNGGELTAITLDKAVDIDPIWSRDGNFVLFSSDRSGVYNLYAYQVSDGTLQRVTNVLTGAFQPDVSPDGKTIAFVEYGADGYGVHTMAYDSESWKPAENVKDTFPSWNGFPQTSYPIHSYDARLSLSPKFWLPVMNQTQLGFWTFGQDALLKHQYTFSFGFDWKVLLPFYHFSYQNHQTLPILSFDLEKKLREPGKLLQESFQSALVVLPFVHSLQNQINLTFDYHRSEVDRITHRVGSELSWAYRSGFDLWQNDWEISLGAATTTSTGDLYWHNQLTLEFQDKLRLPLEATHSISVRAALGVGEKTATFAIGGDSGKFSLRGFKRGEFSGAQAFTGSLEYRFPLLSIERGIGLWPLFFDDIRGAVFVDAGAAGDSFFAASAKISVGGELNFSFVLGYIAPLNVSVGIVYGMGSAKPIFYGGANITAF
ncbi:PD40 domain-containing protein [Candidatus Acetothermia bacterium]|nr:PD40 domain-containing protein [Candidatus Acetothermia bacterium]